MKYTAEQYPKISVITAVYNGAKFIERSINSLLSQNYPNLEYLILDAGSKDGTVEIISKYNEHINYFRSHKDNGPHDAINEGIDNATGDIIGLLNADDYFNDGLLLKLGEAFIENPDVEMVNFNGQIISGKDGRVLKTSSRSMDISNGNVPMIRPNCRFYKKDVFDKYGKIIDVINGKATHFADYEFITRLSLHNIKNISLPITGYTYVSHEESLTFNTNLYTKLKISNETVYYIEGLLKNYRHLMDDKLTKSFNRKLEKAYKGRILKNMIDKDHHEAKNNLKTATELFGKIFYLKFLKYRIDYNLKLLSNKLHKK
jgi:glycosyltransferase involved in cell wall biosynthesis